MKPRLLNILLIEDDPGDADYLQEIIAEANGIDFDITTRDRLEGAVCALFEAGFDAVLLDLNLPDSNGIETFERIHEAAGMTPIIILSGLDDEKTAHQSMQEGAQDYLVKTGLTGSLLVRTICHSIERQHLLQEVEQIRDRDIQRKDAFISHLSHELRSPMTSIYQFTSLLLDGAAGNISEEQSECLEIIMRNSRQLRKMIDDLLEMSRVDMGKLSFEPRSTALDETVCEVINALRPVSESNGISLDVDIDDNLPSIFADPARIRQVLTNLIDNANKFTRAGGTITVKAQIHADEPGYARITVRDTGEGIEAGNLKKIFERLYQQDQDIDTGFSGLGLGLPICKELIECHGGRIWVDSQPGNGSTFYFTLPIYSIERFLEPILHTWKHYRGDLSLVKINLRARDGRSLDATYEAALQAIRSVVENTSRSGCDLLLPRLNRTESEETLFVVATTNLAGADVLGKRLLQQLNLCKELKNIRLELDITYESLFSRQTPDKGVITAPVQQTEIVRRIEGIIETSKIYKEVVA